MKLSRRRFLHLAAGVAAFSAATRRAGAQTYPTRSVHIVVGFGAGTGLDLYARLIGQWLSERLGQPVIIDNRPGAGTNLATETVVNAAPDGYTLLMASTAAFTNAALYDNLRFNFIRDIAPVASLSRGAFVMVVSPSFPARTVPEFIAYAKANPGQVNMASGGIGTTNHVAGELLKAMAGIDMMHVPYRADGAAITDLLGGRVQVYFVALAGAAGFIKDGKLRALAVTTAQRSAAFPDIPAVAESVPGYEASLRNGIGAPKGTPADIIGRLNADINAGLNDATIRSKFADLGTETVPLTPAEYGKIIVEETEKWGKVIRGANIKAQYNKGTMKLPRRKFLRLAAGAAALPAVARSAAAQSYPARPVRIIVGFTPGGPPDVLSRLMGHWLSDRLGQQFIVESRPGAGSNIGTETVVNAPADGYTLLLVSSGNAVNTTLYDKLNFDFIRDIAPVAGLIRAPNLMVVNPQVPAHTVPEFIAYAKANPGKINMASSGNGTSPHVAGELFKLMAGVDMVHVPYRGGAPALTDLIAGQVQVYFTTVANGIEYVRAGKLRALAVSTTERLDVLPELPTLSEFVPGYEASGWFGIGAPKATPAEIVDRLNKEINAGLADPKLKARLHDLGGTLLSGSPAEFGKLIADETEKWGKVIRAANIKAQ